MEAVSLGVGVTVTVETLLVGTSTVEVDATLGGSEDVTIEDRGEEEMISVSIEVSTTVEVDVTLGGSEEDVTIEDRGEEEMLFVGVGVSTTVETLLVGVGVSNTVETRVLVCSPLEAIDISSTGEERKTDVPTRAELFPPTTPAPPFARNKTTGTVTTAMMAKMANIAKLRTEMKQICRRPKHRRPKHRRPEEGTAIPNSSSSSESGSPMDLRRGIPSL